MNWLQVLIPGVGAALVTMILTPSVVKLAVCLHVVDKPGGRKKHIVSTPRLGGIAIMAGILVSLVPSLLLLSGQTLSPKEIIGFSIATLIIFTLGLFDDIYTLGPFMKLVVQVGAAAIVVALGWQFTALRFPWDGRLYVGAVAPLLSVIWIVGVTNAINFIDGLDGLAAGLVAIISCSLLMLSVLQNRPASAIAASCMVGACLGFLRHNWHPAKIYMGDSGSLTLGFLLATFPLRSSIKASAAVAILVPILALGLPVFDTLLVMWYRFLRGHRKANRLASIFHADRSHLHHLLISANRQRSRVIFTLYALAVAFCAMALLVAVSGNWWLGLGFLSIEFVAVLLIRTVRPKAEATLESKDNAPESPIGEELDNDTQVFDIVP